MNRAATSRSEADCRIPGNPRYAEQGGHNTEENCIALCSAHQLTPKKRTPTPDTCECSSPIKDILADLQPASESSTLTTGPATSRASSSSTVNSSTATTNTRRTLSEAVPLGRVSCRRTWTKTAARCKPVNRMTFGFCRDAPDKGSPHHIEYAYNRALLGYRFCQCPGLSEHRLPNAVGILWMASSESVANISRVTPAEPEAHRARSVRRRRPCVERTERVPETDRDVCRVIEPWPELSLTNGVLGEVDDLHLDRLGLGENDLTFATTSMMYDRLPETSQPNGRPADGWALAVTAVAERDLRGKQAEIVQIDHERLAREYFTPDPEERWYWDLRYRPSPRVLDLRRSVKPGYPRQRVMLDLWNKQELAGINKWPAAC